MLKFCKQREIPYEDIVLHLNEEWNPELRRITRIKVIIELPPSFPAKYREAIVRTADQCTVKRHLVAPPETNIETKEKS